jgi:hypothetical protein
MAIAPAADDRAACASRRPIIEDEVDMGAV